MIRQAEWENTDIVNINVSLFLHSTLNLLRSTLTNNLAPAHDNPISIPIFQFNIKREPGLMYFVFCGGRLEKMLGIPMLTL